MTHEHWQVKSAKKFCLCLCRFYLSTGTHFEDDRHKDSFSKIFFLFSTFCFYFNNCGAKIGSSFKIIITGFQTVKKTDWEINKTLAQCWSLYKVLCKLNKFYHVHTHIYLHSYFINVIIIPWLFSHGIGLPLVISFS